MAKDLRQLSEDRGPGVLGELWAFITHNKKWWLTPILLMLVAVLASAIPGWRATRVDPIKAMQS